MGDPSIATDVVLTGIERIQRLGWVQTPSCLVFDRLTSIAPADWQTFVDSWNDLVTDTFMADGGRYRRRRHAVLTMDRHQTLILPQQPHYQSREHNVLNGGVARRFAAVDGQILSGAVMAAMIDLCDAMFRLEGNSARVEVHQFRIEATDRCGLPTPEGMHRDGVDWVCVFLVSRRNVTAGATQIKVNGDSEVREFTLSEPLDAVFLDDRRVMHAVTPITRIDETLLGYRDVLVLTFSQGSQSLQTVAK